MTSVSEIIIKQLKSLGVKFVFGIPGGPWVPFMEAMRVEGIKFVLVSNEGSAGFMADVTARLTGVPGVCHGTFGPGATNVATGVGGGLLDRSALIVLTSEMPDSMLNRTTQMGIDQQKLFERITKNTFRLQPEHPAQQIFDAMQESLSGMPGSIHIGVPSDIGDNECEEKIISTPLKPETFLPASVVAVQRVGEQIKNAEKPLLVVGLTAAREGVSAEVKDLAEKLNAPVVITPMAKGIISEDHPSYQGVLFHALSTELIDVIAKADLIVAVGYDPIEVNFEPWVPENTPVVSIDICPADLNLDTHTLSAEAVGTVKDSLAVLLPLVEKSTWLESELVETQARIRKIFASKLDTFGPVSALTALREEMASDGILTLDVGAHLHLAGQLWKTPAVNHCLMTNGWSSMGFGVPAAIAAKLSCPEKDVACVTGDGGFLMMAGEIVTARRLGLNVVFVVLADRELSLIAVKQDWRDVDRYGTDLYVGEYFGTDTFMGAPVYRAESREQMNEAVAKGFKYDGPVIVEAVVDGAEYQELISKKYK